MSRFRKILIGLTLASLLLLHLVALGALFAPPRFLFLLSAPSGFSYLSASQITPPLREAFSFLAQSSAPDPSFFPSPALSALLDRRYRRLSDEDRFELLANTLDFGGGVRGMEAASQYYFHQPASQLSLDQAEQLVAAYRVFGG